MSDYKRFVSYIYGYDQGEKGENTGFVKVNARGGECRIWVHVKGFYSQRQKPYRVYVFKQKRERLEGQYLGELESRNGALEWNGVTQTDSLMGGFGLDESRGIYIEGENRVFAAEWDDYPVDVDRFRPLERSARQEEAENGVEKFFPAPSDSLPSENEVSEEKEAPVESEMQAAWERTGGSKRADGAGGSRRKQWSIWFRISRLSGMRMGAAVFCQESVWAAGSCRGFPGTNGDWGITASCFMAFTSTTIFCCCVRKRRTG